MNACVGLDGWGMVTIRPGPDANTSPQAEFSLLGSLSVSIAGKSVTVHAAKVRIVFATMLLRPHRSTSVHELADCLWGDSPPVGARNAVQTYVMRLRKALGPTGHLIRTDPSGYRLDVSDCIVDLHVFSGHLARARTARADGDTEAERVALHNGLALWRGQPLMDVPSRTLQVYYVPRLLEERLQALERRIDIDLAHGRIAELVGELQQLTAEHRLRERFSGQLMFALSRLGRQAEALHVYAQVRTLLRDEMGLDPNDELQELHQHILVAKQPPVTSRAPVVVSQRPLAAPFQVPPDIIGFTGRTELVEQIRLLTDSGDEQSSAVPVVVLSGPPGVGKSALAIHSAQRLIKRFPDGQLYVNLRGHSMSPPMRANEALERFLRALGTPPEMMPHAVDEQSALFRSILHERRMLVVLDDAGDAEQVRPLLPGGARCVVLVTSRNNLPGLSALNGARRLPVPTISSRESLDLLAAILGPARIAGAAAAAATLVEACGGLPLALRIVAANIAAEPKRSIESTVAQLQLDRLGSMVIDGDEESAVRRAFELSYRTLDPGLARVFRLLSLIPGATFDEWVAANVAGVKSAAAQRMVLRLRASNLVLGDGQARLQFHHLVRDYALERVLRDDAAEVDRAYRRLLDFYLHAARAACTLLYPDLETGPALPPATDDLTLPNWAGTGDALRWLDAEADNIVAMVGIGSDRTEGLPVPLLPITLLSYFLRRRQDAAWQTAFTDGLALAEKTGDLAVLAALHRGLGLLHFLHSDYEPARSHYLEALREARLLDDPFGQARVLYDLGAVGIETGAYGKAIQAYEEALDLLPDSGEPTIQINTLTDLGIALHAIGSTDRGVRHLRDALAISDRTGVPHLTARATAAIAYGDLAAGNLRAATEGFTRALTIWKDLGYGAQVAETLRNLAETYWEASRLDESRNFAERALSVAQEIGDPWTIVGSHTTLGVLYEQDGTIHEAMLHLEQAVEGALAALQYWRSPVVIALAACHRRLGATGRATVLVEEAMRDARPRVRGRAHAERARIALADGDVGASIEHAWTAKRISRRRGYRLDDARASEILGEAHHRVAEVEEARVHFRHAQLGYAEEAAVAADRVRAAIEHMATEPDLDRGDR